MFQRRTIYLLGNENGLKKRKIEELELADAKKKSRTNEPDANDEEESVNDSDNEEPIDSNNEQSYESSDECLHIDTKEEISMRTDVLELFNVKLFIY